MLLESCAHGNKLLTRAAQLRVTVWHDWCHLQVLGTISVARQVALQGGNEQCKKLMYDRGT